jgi:hypothetical protein
MFFYDTRILLVYIRCPIGYVEKYTYHTCIIYPERSHREKRIHSPKGYAMPPLADP